jgi:hypothetical protein
VAPAKNGDFFLSGYAANPDGSTGHAAMKRLDKNGNLLWELSVGGSGDDDGLNMYQLSNGNILFTAYTNSSDGDVINNHGGYDGWFLIINGIGPLKTTNTIDGKNKSLHLTNFPDPFSQSTTISFSLPASEKVSLKVLDLSGRVIKVLTDEEMNEGYHELSWDVNERYPSGSYFLTLETPEERETRLISIQ